MSNGETLSMSDVIGKEWREMSIKQKSKYEEDYRKKLEVYRRQKKEFSKNFVCKRDEKLYLLSIKNCNRTCAYHEMRKERASRLPKEERWNYIRQ